MSGILLTGFPRHKSRTQVLEAGETSVCMTPIDGHVLQNLFTWKPRLIDIGAAHDIRDGRTKAAQDDDDARSICI